MDNGIGEVAVDERMHEVIVRNTQAWVRADAQLQRFDERLGTMNAYLERTATKTARTAEILSEMREDRIRAEEVAIEAAQDRRAIARKVGAEVWSVFKQPLGLLVAAALAYFAWSHFQIPPTPSPVDVQVVE